MRKRVSVAPFWITRSDLHDGGTWAFNHNRKRYTAPAGTLDLPEDMDNPIPTQDAIEWQREIMERLEPGWPFPTMIVRWTHLSQLAANKLERLTTRGNRSAVIRRSVANLLKDPGVIRKDPRPSVVDVGFRITAVHDALVNDLAKRRHIPRWWVYDHAIRRQKINSLAKRF